ncbi:NF-kappa-B inhibitor delta [Pleurodeles waltl]|uniref:NF-kappa-B inhibitor delta n=1 Tax=Pleurodeles waltl TaxID=8319 RepID=UPI003709B33A
MPKAAFKQERSSCYSPQTVKKLLEEKRRRETGNGQATTSQVQPLLKEDSEPGQIRFSESMGTPATAECSGPFLSWPPAASSGPRWTEYHYHYSPTDDFAGPLSPYHTSLGYESVAAAGHSPPMVQHTHRSHNLGIASQFTTSEFSSEHLEANIFEEPLVSGLAWQGQSPSVPCSEQGSVPFLTPSGPLISELNLAELEQARAEIRNLDSTRLLNQDEDGDTLLHLYAAKGLRYHAYVLAEHFQEFGQLDIKEHKGKTPLLVATTANQPEIVHDLITLGADVNAVDQKGQTPLHLAASYGFPDIIKVIAAQRPQNINIEARNFEGLTPLHCAIITQNSTFKKLLAGFFATGQVQLRNQETQTCIHLLLQLGANCATQDMKSNKTVLHFAVQDGNLPMVTYFLELPKQDQHTFVNMKAHGNTALHMAAGLNGHFFQEEIIRLLLNHGADASIRNLENEQAVHLLPPGETAEQIRHMLKRSRAMSSSRHRSVSL